MLLHLEEEFVLKIRIKFAKRGAMKFISHLDVMRYFQKVVKRADIDIAYSSGFNPHQIMSFAAPLGLGLNSEAEYVDIEVHSTMSTKMALEKLNEVSVKDMPVLSYKLLDDNATKAMTLVAASDYFVRFRDGYAPNIDMERAIQNFLAKDKIVIIKETKKGTKEMDLKPLIYEFKTEDGGYFLKLAAGSVDNLKPELVMEELLKENNISFNSLSLLINRLEIYGIMESEAGSKLAPLESFGEDIA